MSDQVGVWIDHHGAVVVFITSGGTEIKKIASGLERPVRTRSHNPSPTRYVPEDTRERKRTSRLQDFFDEVIATLRGAKAVLILGPGEAKGEFLKRLGKPRGLVAEVKTADKMTDRQLAAKVARHFAIPAARTAVTPKAKRSNKSSNRS